MTGKINISLILVLIMIFTIPVYSISIDDISFTTNPEKPVKNESFKFIVEIVTKKEIYAKVIIDDCDNFRVLDEEGKNTDKLPKRRSIYKYDSCKYEYQGFLLPLKTGRQKVKLKIYLKGEKIEKVLYIDVQKKQMKKNPGFIAETIASKTRVYKGEPTAQISG